MATATLASRLLGLVREQVIASTFGASGITDAFTVAYRIPNMLRDLFAEGAFSSAFVPVFTEERLKGHQRARRLLWSLFVLLTLMTGAISLAIILYAPTIVHWATGQRFVEDPERLALTIQLTRWMAPFLTLVSLAALFMGALNSLKIFFLPALAPAFFNLVMIACVLTLPPWMERWELHPVFCLAVGVIGGGALQMLVQVPLVLKKRLAPTWRVQFSGQVVKTVVHRLGIGTLGIAANQINILVTTVLATGAQLGALSWLTYAFRLFQFPVGLLSVPIANANLVHFSDLWKSGKREEAVDSLQTSYTLSWFVLTPALCILYATSSEAVQLIFERGAFDAFDRTQTALALRAYILGLPFYGLYKLFAPTFFALDQPRIPVAVSAVSVFCNIAFCWFTVPRYGFHWLALGTSLSMALNCCALACFLKRRPHLPWRFFFNLKVANFALAGVGCFCTIWWIKQFSRQFSWQFGPQWVSLSLNCLGWAAIGGLAYLAFVLALDALWGGGHILAILRRRWRRGR